MKKKIQKFLKNFFSTQNGTATGISLGFSAGIMAVSLTTVAVVNNTVQENKNVEDSSIAYFSAERGIEYSLLDVAGHASGYEITKENKDRHLKTTEKEAKTSVLISSRSKKDATENKIIVPQKGTGNSKKDNNWNSISKGGTATIPLYIDNTAK